MTKRRRARHTKQPIVRRRAGERGDDRSTGNGDGARRRRAPTTVTLADRARPPTDERGAAGTVSWGGVLSAYDADYAEAWKLPRRWETAEKMRSDPAVSAT